MADANIWGAGGLFERALERKMANVDSNTALNNSRVGVDMLNSDRNYDIGLRNAASTEYANETSRLAQSPISPVNFATANNLRLKTFAPMSDAQIGQQLDAKSALYGVNFRDLTARAMTPNNSVAAAPASTAAAPAATPAAPLAQKPTEIGMAAGVPAGIKKTIGADGRVEYSNGFRNGGVVMKPKMVSQPGYKHGGKVTMPKGYKKGGKIGDVNKDEGKDTMDVKARPGEYFLNPETVAYFGGGNYNEGVKFLDDSVRMATGKEPGPTPVGKPGKPGFADSGVNLPAVIEGETVRVSKPPGTALVPVGSPGAQPNWRYYTPPPEPPPLAPEPPLAPRDMRWAYAGKQAGKAVAEGLRQAKDAAMPYVGRVGTGALAAGLEFLMPRHQEFYNDESVPTWDKTRQFLRDAAGEVAGIPTGAVGVGLGGTLGAPAGPIGVGAGAVAGGVSGYALGKGGMNTALNYVLGDSPAALYEQQMRAQGKTPQLLNRSLVGDQDKPTNTEALQMTPNEAARRFALANPPKPQPEAQPEKAPAEMSLREMALNRARALDLMTMVNGGAGSRQLTEMATNAWKDVGEADKNETSRAAAKAQAVTAALKASEDHRETIDKGLKETFKTEYLDEKGNVRTRENPETLAAFRKFMSEQHSADPQRVKSLYDMSQGERDAAARVFHNRYRILQRWNAIQAANGGVTSDTIDSLRLNPNGVGFGSAANYHGVNWWDNAKAYTPFLNERTNMLVEKPIGTDNNGNLRWEGVAADRLFTKDDGTFDADAFEQAKADARAFESTLRKMPQTKK